MKNNARWVMLLCRATIDARKVVEMTRPEQAFLPQSAPETELRSGLVTANDADRHPQARMLDGQEVEALLGAGRLPEGAAQSERRNAEAKITARREAGLLAAQMIAQSGLSLGEIERRHNIGKATLSRLVNGATEAGPSLWLLFSLASALGFELQLSSKRP